MLLHDRHWVAVHIYIRVSFLACDPAPNPSTIGFPSQMTHRTLLVKPCESALGIDLGSGLSPDSSCAVGDTVARTLGIGDFGMMGAMATH